MTVPTHRLLSTLKNEDMGEGINSYQLPLIQIFYVILWGTISHSLLSSKMTPESEDRIDTFLPTTIQP